MRVRPLLALVGLLAALVAGCGSDDDPAGAQDLSCGSKLARHQELGLAVLLSASPTVPDAIIGGQWISPDLRWAAGIDRPLADLRRGVAVQTGVEGEVVAVAGDTGMVRRSGNIASGSGWCTVDLAALLEPDAAFPADCTPLPDPGIVGGYLLDATGTPFWAQSEATRIRLGETTGYAVTDGSRVLRVELFPASEPRADGGAALVLGFADGDRTRFVQLTAGADGAVDLPAGCPAGCRIVTWPDRV